MVFRTFLFLVLLGLFQNTFGMEEEVDRNHYPFIANLGQWQGDFEYRMNVGLSSLFFEKNALHYQMVKGPDHFEMHQKNRVLVMYCKRIIH